MLAMQGSVHVKFIYMKIFIRFYSSLLLQNTWQYGMETNITLHVSKLEQDIIVDLSKMS